MVEKLTRTKLRLTQGSLWESFQDDGVTDEELDALLLSNVVRKKRKDSVKKGSQLRGRKVDPESLKE